MNAIEQFTGIHDANGEPRAHRELAVRRIRRNSRKRLGPERFSFGAEHGQQGVDSSCGNANLGRARTAAYSSMMASQ